MPGLHPTGTLGILSSAELDRDVAGIQGTYGWSVQSGAVTFSSSLTFAVAAIAAGDYTVNSVSGALYAGGTVTLSTQDPTNPRVDRVVITSAGAVSVLAGTPAALTSTSGPTPPAMTSAQLEIARIFVPATGTALTSACITDRRHPMVSQAWQQIAPTQILSGTAASISFAGIDASYKVFRLTLSVKVTAALSLYLRLNNGISGSYDYQSYNAQTGAVTGSSFVSGAGQFQLAGTVNPTAASRIFGEVLIGQELAGDASTLTSSLEQFANAANTPMFQGTAGSWRGDGNLISRIDVIASTSTFAVGSRFVLEGMK